VRSRASLKLRVALQLLGILLVAAFLRLYELPRYPPALHSDEAVNGINALQVIQLHQIKVFYPENNGREGLFINLQALAVSLFGTEAWPLRLVSAMFGTLTVLGLFFLVRELFMTGGRTPASGDDAPIFDPDRLALLTAFFTATSFWHVLVSRLGFRAISAPFWAVWAFYLILASWRKLSATTEKPPASLRSLWLLAFISGIVFGLGFHSYTAYRVMPLLAGIVFVFNYIEAERKGRPDLFAKYAAAVVAGGLIAIAPLAMYFVRHPGDFAGRSSQISVFNSTTPVRDLAGNVVKTLGILHVVGDTNPRHNLTGRPWLSRFAGLAGATPYQQQLVLHLGRPEIFWPIGIFFLIGLFVGLRRVLQETRGFLHARRIPTMRLRGDATPGFQSVFLLSWLVVAAIPAVVSNEDLPHALRTILAIPPVFTFAAMGALVICDRLVRRIEAGSGRARRPAPTRIVVCVCGALLVIQVYVTYFLAWGPAPITAERFNKDINDTAYALRALPPELPKYVIVPPGSLGIEIVQFLTDTYTSETQKQKHIRYVGPDDRELESLPPGAYVTGLK
jgi:4-amino-4-deoxy-L-arabinose transferase-like glycosyltransferase